MSYLDDRRLASKVQRAGFQGQKGYIVRWPLEMKEREGGNQALDTNEASN